MAQTYLITGANRGIGLALARDAAERGHRVIGTARDPASADELKAVAGPGGSVRVEELDAASDASCRTMAERLSGEPIDVLINNAGVFPREASDFMTFDADAYEMCLRTNSIGPLLVSRALVENLAASERKMIVQISSQMGSLSGAAEGGSKDSLAYRSSKAALNMASLLVANGLKDRGIACVAVHPGWVRTDMGGSDAQLEPTDSAASILGTIERLTLAETGTFVRHDGTPIGW